MKLGFSQTIVFLMKKTWKYIPGQWKTGKWLTRLIEKMKKYRNESKPFKLPYWEIRKDRWWEKNKTKHDQEIQKIKTQVIHFTKAWSVHPYSHKTKQEALEAHYEELKISKIKQRQKLLLKLVSFLSSSFSIERAALQSIIVVELR